MALYDFGREEKVFNNENICLYDYGVDIYEETAKDLLVATPISTDYMTEITAKEVIQRYFDIDIICDTRVLVYIHSYADIHYLKVYKDVKTITDIHINSDFVEKITFLGRLNKGGDITKAFINIYCTEVEE